MKDTYISEAVKYIGADDTTLDLFESQYQIPNGVSYNSYVILDEKVAVMDTIDERKTDEWFANLENVLNGRTVDYLVISHLEPDHAANIKRAADKFPKAQLVLSAKAKAMLPQFFDIAHLEERCLVVKEGDTLELGIHKLHFVMAPMVHWPEVMVEYEETEKILFSADGFGKFGALSAEEEWTDEARRYFINIVGKYGVQVQTLLKKAAALDIQTICPLHGPVLTENLEHYIGQYNTWSSYGTESEGVMIAYTSVYGNTKKAVELLAEKLKEKGCPKVVVTDLAREDMAEAVEDAFRYGKIVLASTTYNGDVFPFMKTFIEHLTERNYQNKTIGLIENGSWASMAGKVMTGMFEKSKNITWLETSVKIMSSMDEQNKADIEKMAEELM